MQHIELLMAALAYIEQHLSDEIRTEDFCMLTASSDSAYAEQIADQIRSMNQQTFYYKDREIPLSLYVNTVSLKNCRRPEEIFPGLHSAIDESKKAFYS